jgi:CRP-like cAMP-binding protein
VTAITPRDGEVPDTRATAMPVVSSEIPFSASTHLCEILECLGEEKIVSAGSFLFHRGDNCRGVFVIRDGSVRLSIRPQDAAFDRIAGAGSILGLPSTMSGKPYSLTAEVVDEARVVFVTRHMFLNSLEHNPELCFEVLGLLSREVQQLRERL